MTMPIFLIMGAARSGTTALWKYVNEHPQVYLCTPKHTRFFRLRGRNARLWWTETNAVRLAGCLRAYTFRKKTLLQGRMQIRGGRNSICGVRSSTVSS